SLLVPKQSKSNEGTIFGSISTLANGALGSGILALRMSFFIFSYFSSVCYQSIRIGLWHRTTFTDEHHQRIFTVSLD
ncbi:hypothetical protein OFB63_32145, partial [Escherichia coli]|nr:hypothetical protein [Escherichia coli]